MGAAGSWSARAPAAGLGLAHPTEARVVDLVAEGLTNPQIAERMFISKATVKTHLAHIFRKLDVHSRTELSARAAGGERQPSELASHQFPGNGHETLLHLGPWYRFGTGCIVLSVQIVHGPGHIGNYGRSETHRRVSPLGWGPKGRWFKSSRPD